MGGGLDHSRAYPSPPKPRFDEQAVEFGRALAADDRREPDDAVLDLGDEHLATLDLCGRKVDGVGVGEQILAIFVERQRRAPLQAFELEAFFSPRRPDVQALHAT